MIGARLLDPRCTFERSSRSYIDNASLLHLTLWILGEQGHPIMGMMRPNTDNVPDDER
jgi:hypothetical protein